MKCLPITARIMQGLQHGWQARMGWPCLPARAHFPSLYLLPATSSFGFFYIHHSTLVHLLHKGLSLVFLLLVNSYWSLKSKFKQPFLREAVPELSDKVKHHLIDSWNSLCFSSTALVPVTVSYVRERENVYVCDNLINASLIVNPCRQELYRFWLPSYSPCLQMNGEWK